MSEPTFRGVFPILVTPFHEREDLDLESLARVVDFMAEAGVNGVTILGVLGEANRLVDSERELVIRTAVEASAGRVPVIVGTSHTGTRAALRLSQMAEGLGASGVMVTPAREPVPNEERIFEYFGRIAEGISIPVVVQDHPASTQVHMPVPLLLRLVREIPLVSCIKEEATPTPGRVAALVDGMKDRSVPVLTGLGALYGRFELERGGAGFMTGFAFPEVLRAMVRAAGDARGDDARALYGRFLPLIVFEQQPGLAVRKEIYRRRGLIESSRVRHPGASIDAASAAQLGEVLESVLPDTDLKSPLAL